MTRLPDRRPSDRTARAEPRQGASELPNLSTLWEDRIEATSERMMSSHETRALRHPHIVAFHKFFSEYHIFFEVDGDRFRVSIRVYETGDGRYFFEQSHYIHTPVQEAAHVLQAERHAEPHAALSRAVESITTYYEEAVGQGYRPDASWFVRNDVY